MKQFKQNVSYRCVYYWIKWCWKPEMVSIDEACKTTPSLSSYIVV